MNDVITQVASQLHEDWRAPRLQADGTFEPRFKDDGNGGVIDIANTPFPDLPYKWQAENINAATSAVQAVTTSTSLEDAAAQVHLDWLARNGEWAPAEQKLPYSELDEVEKEKDRVVARLAATAAGISLS